MYVFSPPVLLGLQLLGLLPVSVDDLPLRGNIASVSRPRWIYSILLLISLCTYFGMWLYSTTADRLRLPQTTLKIFSTISAFSALFGAGVAVEIAVASVKRKILLVEKMREVDFLLLHKPGSPRSRKISLVILGAVTALNIAELVHFTNSDLGRSRYQVMFTNILLEYLKLVILFGLLEVMEIILSVRDRFKLVNERVVEVILKSRFKQLSYTNPKTLPCIETVTKPQEIDTSIYRLSDVHWRLCRIVHDINDVYGCQFVTSMIFIFAHLLFTPYLVFLNLTGIQNDFGHMKFTGIWITLLVVELYMMVLPCSLAAKEAKNTVVIVTNLMGNKVAKSIFKELETFADQLLHRHVKFTACGLFTLQTPMTVSVASAVTTYMAIIFQFQTSSHIDVNNNYKLHNITSNITEP